MPVFGRMVRAPSASSASPLQLADGGLRHTTPVTSYFLSRGTASDRRFDVRHRDCVRRQPADRPTPRAAGVVTIVSMSQVLSSGTVSVQSGQRFGFRFLMACMCAMISPPAMST